MNHNSIILAVSKTLKDLFTEKSNDPSVEDKDNLLGKANITFNSPTDIEDDNTLRLLIYLYNISLETHLTNELPERQRQSNGQLKIAYKPPLPLELYYLLVPYGPDRIAEILMIEQIEKTLYENAIFSNRYHNILFDTGYEMKLTQIPLSIDDLNKIWGWFSQKAFKLSVAFKVTPVLLPTTQQSPYTHPITQVQFKVPNETIDLVLSRVVKFSVKGNSAQEIVGDFTFTIYNKTHSRPEVQQPVKYQADYYLIMNLAAGRYQITIDSTYYQQVIFGLDIPDKIDPQDIVTQIELEHKNMK